MRSSPKKSSGIESIEIPIKYTGGKCEDCIYWHRLTDPFNKACKHGRCQYNPPVVVSTAAGFESELPVSLSDSFCSKYSN